MPDMLPEELTKVVISSLVLCTKCSRVVAMYEEWFFQIIPMIMMLITKKIMMITMTVTDEGQFTLENNIRDFP